MPKPLRMRSHRLSGEAVRSMVRGNWGIGAISSTGRLPSFWTGLASGRADSSVRDGTMDCRLGAKESVRGWSLAWAGVAAKRAPQARAGRERWSCRMKRRVQPSVSSSVIDSLCLLFPARRGDSRGPARQAGRASGTTFQDDLIAELYPMKRRGYPLPKVKNPGRWSDVRSYRRRCHRASRVAAAPWVMWWSAKGLTGVVPGLISTVVMPCSLAHSTGSAT